MSQRRRKPAEAPLCLTCGKIIVEKSKDSTLNDCRTLGHEHYWQIDEQAPSAEGWEVEVTCKRTGARLVPRNCWPYRTLNLVSARRPVWKPKSMQIQACSSADEDWDEEDLQPERLHCAHCNGVVVKAGKEAPKRRGPVTRQQTRKTPKKTAAKRKSGKRKPSSACKPPVPQKKRKVTQKAEHIVLSQCFDSDSDSDSDSELLSSDSDTDTDSSYALPPYKAVVIREMLRLGRTPNAQYTGKATPGSLLLEKQQAEQAKLKAEAALRQQEEEAALRQQEEEAFKGIVHEQQNKHKEEEEPQQQAEDLQQVQEEQEEQAEAATMHWQQYGQREGESNVFASSSDEKLTLVWKTNKKMN